MSSKNNADICSWGREPEIYRQYHDREWGVPVTGDQELFEFLILEGAQAGLSWLTILQRRDGYRKAFFKFDIERCAALTDADIEQLLTDTAIVRNRLKVSSVPKNARAVLVIIEQFGSFNTYLESFFGDEYEMLEYASMGEVPAESAVSQAISKDMKKRGMSFVGPTIMYAFLQAAGFVNDHIVSCSRYQECCELVNRERAYVSDDRKLGS